MSWSIGFRIKQSSWNIGALDFEESGTYIRINWNYNGCTCVGITFVTHKSEKKLRWGTVETFPVLVFIFVNLQRDLIIQESRTTSDSFGVLPHFLYKKSISSLNCWIGAWGCPSIWAVRKRRTLRIACICGTQQSLTVSPIFSWKRTVEPSFLKWLRTSICFSHSWARSVRSSFALPSSPGDSTLPAMAVTERQTK